MKATSIVHWSGGISVACDVHTAELKKALEALGFEVSLEALGMVEDPGLSAALRLRTPQCGTCLSDLELMRAWCSLPDGPGYVLS